VRCKRVRWGNALTRTKPSIITATLPSSSTSYSPAFREEKVPDRRIFWEYNLEFSGENSVLPRGALATGGEEFQRNFIP
jgi:hypothetical protein